MPVRALLACAKKTCTGVIGPATGPVPGTPKSIQPELNLGDAKRHALGGQDGRPLFKGGSPAPGRPSTSLSSRGRGRLA